MKSFIVFTVIFVILKHVVMSHGLVRYLNLTTDSHEDNYSNSDSSSYDERIFSFETSSGSELPLKTVTNDNYREQQIPTRTTGPTTKITTPPPTTTKRSTTKILSYRLGYRSYNQDFLNCVNSCPVSEKYNPVCGTDFVTYTNAESLICRKRCGLDVSILLTSPCPPNIAKTFSSTRMPSTITTPKTITTTTAKTNSKSKFGTRAQQQCVMFCDHNTEWRPVCGSNDVTYRNTNRLSCAQKCGIDVKLKKQSICMNEPSELTPSTTQKSVETVTDDVFKKSCVMNCKSSSEYNPVCGTDNVTYKNPSIVQCLIDCGINVTLRTSFACKESSVVLGITSSENPGNVSTTSTTSVPEVTNGPKDQDVTNNVSDENQTQSKIDFK